MIDRELMQPEQDPTCAHGVSKIKCEFCKQPEQAQPWGWRWKERINGELDSWVVTSSEPPPYAIEKQPLYTAPPQRQPLTDEDLIECERLADIRHRKHIIRGQQLSPAGQFLWHYARAIEAAHGIGEKNT